MKWGLLILAVIVVGAGASFAESTTPFSGDADPQPGPQPDGLDNFDEFDFSEGDNVDAEQVARQIAAQMGVSDAMLTWGLAIYHHEGAGVRDRNKNPGNLIFANQPGAVLDPQGNRFAHFSTWEQGWSALFRQLRVFVNRFPKFTILQMMDYYLGGKDPQNPRVTREGDPFKYADDVAGAVGVDTSATLRETFA